MLTTSAPTNADSKDYVEWQRLNTKLCQIIVDVMDQDDLDRVESHVYNYDGKSMWTEICKRYDQSSELSTHSLFNALYNIELQASASPREFILRATAMRTRLKNDYQEDFFEQQMITWLTNKLPKKYHIYIQPYML